MGTSNFDKLKEGGRDVPSGAQHADITRYTQTSSAPAALTSAQISGGESPTEAEFNALQADVSALRTKLAALVVDQTAVITKLNAALDTLDAFQETA